jgi:hypothetical protein
MLEERLEDIKGIFRDANRRRTNNTMAKRAMVYIFTLSSGSQIEKPLMH